MSGYFFDTIPLRKFGDKGKQGNNTRLVEIQIAQQNYSFSQSKTFIKYYLQHYIHKKSTTEKNKNLYTFYICGNCYLL